MNFRTIVQHLAAVSNLEKPVRVLAFSGDERYYQWMCCQLSHCRRTNICWSSLWSFCRYIFHLYELQAHVCTFFVLHPTNLSFDPFAIISRFSNTFGELANEIILFSFQPTLSLIYSLVIFSGFALISVPWPFANPVILYNNGMFYEIFLIKNVENLFSYFP